ncbi:hypothetical protein DFH08DRAFT_964061 [Mycena albidolilacea]|uniref:Uncharacterized protein n=1 Tax=Mycena albidolilacea TaxID=1033008 RepID=A0AAD7EMJ3_9AGAR|nr:hypothetical protein DFH08DRAFT_964061 [Mycena albidolilacea]
MVSHAAISADTRLHCIVFLGSQPAVADTSPLSMDSRFVCVQQTLDYRLDWLQGAVSGEDYWALADAFIAARRAGKADLDTTVPEPFLRLGQWCLLGRLTWAGLLSGGSVFWLFLLVPSGDALFGELAIIH